MLQVSAHWAVYQMGLDIEGLEEISVTSGFVTVTIRFFNRGLS
jgi:hypothetical protein